MHIDLIPIMDSLRDGLLKYYTKLGIDGEDRNEDNHFHTGNIRCLLTEEFVLLSARIYKIFFLLKNTVNLLPCIAGVFLPNLLFKVP